MVNKKDKDDVSGDLGLDARPLEEQLLEKAYEREVLGEAESLLGKGHAARAAAVLRDLRAEFPRGGGGPDLFDTVIASSPLGEGFHHEARARVYQDARLLRDARGDLVRALLVTPGELGPRRLIEKIDELDEWPLLPWMLRAVEAVEARLKGKREREKRRLLEAIRKAPDELALFTALALNELGSCSDVELFALRQCVRVAPGWTFARRELYRAAKAIGDADAVRIEPRPIPGGHEAGPSRGKYVA